MDELDKFRKRRNVFMSQSRRDIEEMRYQTLLTQFAEADRARESADATAKAAAAKLLAQKQRMMPFQKNGG